MRRIATLDRRRRPAVSGSGSSIPPALSAASWWYDGYDLTAPGQATVPNRIAPANVLTNVGTTVNLGARPFWSMAGGSGAYLQHPAADIPPSGGHSIIVIIRNSTNSTVALWGSDASSNSGHMLYVVTQLNQAVARVPFPYDATLSAPIQSAAILAVGYSYTGVGGTLQSYERSSGFSAAVTPLTATSDAAPRLGAWRATALYSYGGEIYAAVGFNQALSLGALNAAADYLIAAHS